MKTPIVSVIIPIYNAEPYIEQCLDSLLKQTFQNYEIICIDDGSEDCSYEILKKYEKSDSRVRAYSQKNQFAGVARNIGIEKAKGKYLLFLDADDFFEANMLEELICIAEKYNTEILIFDAFKYDDLTKSIINDAWSVLSPVYFGDGTKSSAELSDVVFQITTPSPWNKLFLRKYIENNSLRFQPIQRTNDLFFVFAALTQAERIGILNKRLVYYRVNNRNSLQGSIENTPLSFSDALVALKKYLEEKKSWDKYKKSFFEMVSEVCVNNLTNMHSKQTYILLCKKIKNEVIPKLKMEIDEIDEDLKKVFSMKRDVIVYGAGSVSKALIKYLTIKYRYDTGRIKIAVTKTSNNGDELYGIHIVDFAQLHLDKYKDIIIIAVSGRNQQNEIEKYVQMQGFVRIFKIDFKRILSLICADEVSTE